MANEIYQAPETAITWLASGGTNLFTPTSLGAGAGRQGALHDRGTAASAFKYSWRFWTKFATSPIVPEYIGIFIKTSDGTSPDNDDGTGDIAVSSEDKLLDLRQIGSMVVDEASTTPLFVASGTIEITQRWLAPVIWNFTNDGLSATAGDHGFSLTPVPLQIQ